MKAEWFKNRVEGLIEGLIVTTNNKWNNFLYRHEVPANVLKSQFDYMDENDDTDGFFCYRGTWYHLNQFEYRQMGNWDGIHNHGFTCGVLIKVSKDGEQYRIGSYRTKD